MAKKEKKTNIQTNVHMTQHRKLKNKQHESHLKQGAKHAALVQMIFLSLI